MIKEVEISLDDYLAEHYCSTEDPDIISVDTRFFTIRLRSVDNRDGDCGPINTELNINDQIIPPRSIIRIKEILELLLKLKNFFMKGDISAVIIKNSEYDNISTVSESPRWIKYLRFQKIVNSGGPLYIAYSYYLGKGIAFIDWKNCLNENNYLLLY